MDDFDGNGTGESGFENGVILDPHDPKNESKSVRKQRQMRKDARKAAFSSRGETAAAYGARAREEAMLPKINGDQMIFAALAVYLKHLSIATTESADPILQEVVDIGVANCKRRRSEMRL